MGSLAEMMMGRAIVLRTGLLRLATSFSFTNIPVWRLLSSSILPGAMYLKELNASTLLVSASWPSSRFV